MTAGNLNLSETPTQAAVSQKPAKRRTIRTTILFVAAAIVCGAIAISSRKDKPTATEAHQSNSRSAPPVTVSVVHPEKVSSTVTLDLPGQLQAYTDAPIFAQTSGYLKAWHFDIRAKVKGQ